MLSMMRIIKKFSCILEKKQKGFIFIILVMMLIGGIVESVSVSLIFPLIEAVMNEKTWSQPIYAQVICNVFGIVDQKDYIKILIIFLVIIFVVKNLYLLGEYYVQNTFVAKCKYKIQRKLLNRYLRKPYIFFLQASSGEIVRIINDDSSSTFYALSSTLAFSTELIVSIVLAITVILLSPQMAVGMICVLFVEVVVIMGIIKPKLKTYGDKGRTETAIANKWMLQSISGIKSIKVSANEDYFEGNFNRHNRIAVNTLKNYTVLNNIPRLGIEAFTMSGILVVMFVMISRGIQVESLIPGFSAFAVAAVRLLPSTNRISQAYSNVIYSEGAIDSILEVIASDTKEEKSKRIVEQEISFSDRVEMTGITFSYPDTEKKVFENASFVFHPGESVGIVGTSGAGKTTLVDVLLGLLKPQAGSIKSDSIDIEENIVGWLSHLAYIPQTIFLLDDTIRENVLFGSEAESDEDVWIAIRDAQLEDFVRGLPESLDTKIGEAGVRLSGGQRQRIGIARALYTNPDILVFDEATSALDNETEAAIMDSVDKLKGSKTLIIIAHRLTTIEKCDKIYRVENGTIVQER